MSNSSRSQVVTGGVTNWETKGAVWKDPPPDEDPYPGNSGGGRVEGVWRGCEGRRSGGWVRSTHSLGNSFGNPTTHWSLQRFSYVWLTHMQEHRHIHTRKNTDTQYICSKTHMHTHTASPSYSKYTQTHHLPKCMVPTPPLSFQDLEWTPTPHTLLLHTNTCKSTHNHTHTRPPGQRGQPPASRLSLLFKRSHISREC